MNTLKSITPLQWLGIILIINGALIGSTAQLTDLFGTVATKYIVSFASLGNSIAGGIVTFLSGQGSLVKTVAAMPGVQQISVNSHANSTLAQIAVSTTPDAAKVEPVPSDAGKIADIAKSGG